VSEKKTVTNMTGTSIPLSDCILGVAETAEVTWDRTAINYAESGALVVVDKDAEKKGTK